ncbi:unnamed protein product [Amoebophrya sp. A25]|nr:unnamed protein product [Amoebophrya sp. A25]|eukprot:GSA25T00008149001.1
MNFLKSYHRCSDLHSFQHGYQERDRLHNNCCGACPRNRSLRRSAVRAFGGGGGATTSVSMTWSGVLFGHPLVLAVGGASGTFTVQSATAAASDSAKNLMVAANDSILATFSVTCAIVFQLTTDFTGTNFSSYKFRVHHHLHGHRCASRRSGFHRQ